MSNKEILQTLCCNQFFFPIWFGFLLTIIWTLLEKRDKARSGHRTVVLPPDDDDFDELWMLYMLDSEDKLP